MSKPEPYDANLFLHRTLAESAWLATAALWLIWIVMGVADEWDAPTMLGVLAVSSLVMAIRLDARKSELRDLLMPSEAEDASGER